jgi:hypothetical protein
MTIFTGAFGRDFTIIVAVSIAGALVVNAGPIIAIVLNWMG